MDTAALADARGSVRGRAASAFAPAPASASASASSAFTSASFASASSASASSASDSASDVDGSSSGGSGSVGERAANYGVLGIDESEPDSSADEEWYSDDDDADFEREWEENKEQIRLLFTQMIIPFLGRWLGRRFGFMRESPFRFERTAQRSPRNFNGLPDEDSRSESGWARRKGSSPPVLESGRTRRWQAEFRLRSLVCAAIATPPAGGAAEVRLPGKAALLKGYRHTPRPVFARCSRFFFFAGE
ncbi:MAG: hypothetical protein BJ554DRAFT_1767 [Olpidium bornovanus]|uniref:Uncharacterized protein n=1 Tax=Olpidium bornovanus TaxID=278681 RepID=A0A8H7ZRY1_9FUNG|nr:MAG: hypothetical protein BJ554DRAFT_1767 [Olpidium bornovanus]